MKGTAVASAAIAIGLCASATSFADTDELPPQMDRGKPVQCLRDKDGLVWRIQCAEATKTCLYAADSELDSSGERTKPLARAQECSIEASFDRAKLEADGYHVVPGRADAPYGWMRDERGRVFQVNFDLKRRLYFGAGYTPQKVIENPLDSRRTSIDFGLFIFEHLSNGKTPVRHRIRLMEGQVHLEPFSAEVTVAHYDASLKFADPLLRITTFFGRPQRHDLHLDVGLWTEAGGLEIHRTPADYSQLWKHATAQVTLDLWQSARMDSYVRLRTGVGLEGQRTDVTGYRSAVVAQSALEFDLALDDAGFYNIKFEFSHEMPRYFEPLAIEGKLSQRERAHFQYEMIVLAINDQPVTLKLALGGEKRNDLLGVPDQWAFVADAGLRFSLWAPPRPRS